MPKSDYLNEEQLALSLYKNGEGIKKIAKKTKINLSKVFFYTILKKSGFKSYGEYLKYLIKKRGFDSRGEYLNYLAKRKGFYSYKDYRKHQYLKRGFKSTNEYNTCLLYTSPSPRDLSTSRMPSSA